MKIETPRPEYPGQWPEYPGVTSAAGRPGLDGRWAVPAAGARRRRRLTAASSVREGGGGAWEAGEAGGTALLQWE